MKLIPFSLKLAQEGHPIQTRDGRKGTFLCHYAGFKEYERVLVALDKDDDVTAYSESGLYDSVRETSLDLFMAPVKQERWLNVYENEICTYRNRESADIGSGEDRIACIRIEYSEGEGLE